MLALLLLLWISSLEKHWLTPSDIYVNVKVIPAGAPEKKPGTNIP